jgi:hypothetical protein
MLVDKGAAEVGRALETLRRVTQMQRSVTERHPAPRTIDFSARRRRPVVR